MPRVSKRLGSNDGGELLDALVRITDKPALHKKRISEIRQAEDAAAEAESRVIKAKQELAEFAAALDEQKRQQDEREKGLVEREGVIAVRERTAAEQVETAENLVIDARECQRLADDALAVVERKDSELRRIVQDILS